jgi:hypothetical protein
MRFFRYVAALIAFAGDAYASVTPNSIVTAQTPNVGVAQFLQGTDVAGTYKTIYTAGTNGSKCFRLTMNNNDGSATHLVTVQLVRATIQYGGVSVTTVSSAGFANATPPQNLLASGTWPGLPIDGNGNPFFYLNSGDTLQATFATALTTSTVIDVIANCVDF